MCFRDVMNRLSGHCPGLTVTQVRWAITSGRVSRPPLDGSLRFNFEEQHVQELLRHFLPACEPLDARK